jgi:dihydroorotase
MQGEEITEMAELKEVGAVAITDDGRDVASSALMRRVLEYAGMVGLVCMTHNEDETLAAGGAMNEGFTATVLGIPGIPKAAEEIRIDRNIRLAALTGARLHIQHVTSAEGVDIVRRAKARGIRVTCETAPHYWTLTDEAVKSFNSNAKMNPPLREAEDRAAIIAGIQDGTIDCIATDHAPHTPTEKNVEFQYAPFGIIGLETSLALTLTGLVEAGHITLERAIALMTVEAAKICGLDAGVLKAGGPADIAIFNPKEEWTVKADGFASRSCNSPFIGQTLRGRVRYTLCDGRIVYQA